MRRDDIHALTRAQPFRPFRVTLASGEEFDVFHPDMIIAASGMAVIARPAPAGAPDDADSVVHVSLVQIVKIEFLTPGAAPPLNRSTV
ncbi:MAG: hypothetical protein ABGY75_11400 [Gemmataceae bacterium]